MALTGLQIQKLLPGTNCKECGSNTCMAFAMKLASKKAELNLCPYASDEAKSVLGAASEPPVKSIALGKDGKLILGEETVLYRHEKTFVKPAALAVNINDTDSDKDIDAVLDKLKNYSFVRVGETFVVDMIAVTQIGTDGKKFITLVKKAYETTGKPLVLNSTDVSAMKEASGIIKGSRSVVRAQSPEMAEALLDTVKGNELVLSISAPDVDSLAALSSKIKDSGFTNLILEFKTGSIAEQFQTNSIARRAAIKDAFKPLGNPFLRFIDTGDFLSDTAEAVTEIIKYGSICVLPGFDAAQMATLMTLRLNIYTDPQKPIQMEPGIYPIGDPNPDSPVFVTTNFSLTYFVVSAEIENSGVSAWLVVPECEGMSVLTAWAAGKFTAASIAKFIKEVKLEEKVKRRDIVIPGYIAPVSGELEENLPGWKVLIGPQEASDLESYIKTKISA
jgi:acetyl-CoA decarbonylase/synthase complex subunit gamma